MDAMAADSVRLKAAENAELRRQIAEQAATIATLKAEARTSKTSVHDGQKSDSAEIVNLRRENLGLKMELHRLTRERAPGGSSDEVKALRAQVKSLDAQVASWKGRAQPKPPPNPSEVEAKLRKKLAEMHYWQREIINSPKDTVFIAKKDHRIVRNA